MRPASSFPDLHLVFETMYPYIGVFFQRSDNSSAFCLEFSERRMSFFVRIADFFFAQNYYNDLMGENQFFISYSRHQLYFAEALALSLQKAGLDVWMDLHQLEPGSDWRDQIDEGLRNCAALVLVVSKQALSSPFVESEWRAMIDSGKPVYIAYYQEVNLPPQLQSACLVDFRGSFKKATSVLVTALKNMSSVRETVQPPNRLGLPQKMPPIIMLVAGLLVIGSFFPLLVDFTIFGGAIAQIACAGMLVPSIWVLVWQFLHHKVVLVAGRLTFWSLLMIPLPLSEWLGIESRIGMVVIGTLPYLGVLTSIYLVERGSFGAELLRWSTTGSDNEMVALRRRFHKSLITNDKQIENIPQQALNARNIETKESVGIALHQDTSQLRPDVGEAFRTYSLHYAAADEPVAATLRKMLNREGLQEVDSNARNQILILSEKLSRSKLQALLGSGEPVIPVLISNFTFQGDVVLEQAASLQLIDYRDRSKTILAALARTLKELPDGNLPIGFETTPRPLHSTVLPLFVSMMTALVMITGGWLVLSGLVSITQSLAGTAPVSLLDLVGSVCGFIWIKVGKAVLPRETTDLHFIPALMISTWLAGPLFLGPFFEAPQLLSTNAAFDWTITLKSLLTSETYLGCLICSGVVVVVPVTIIWFRRFGDWLPASITGPVQTDRFKPPVATAVGQRSGFATFVFTLFISGLCTFGLRVVIYVLFSLLISNR